MRRYSGVRHSVGEVQHRSIRVTHLSIEKFVELMKPGFTFARYGDGAFLCMQGAKGHNCDGAAYGKQQADLLLASIKDKSISHAIGTLARRTTNAANWLLDRDIDIDWYDCDVMNNASDEGKMFPFIDLLRKRKIVFCGPAHLHKLRAFPILSFVVCDSTKAFDEVDALEDELVYRVEKEEADTILLSAGTFASPVLVSRLHSHFPKAIILDTGSIWDPYVKVFSRSGHAKRGWKEYIRLGRLNFQQDIESW